MRVFEIRETPGTLLRRAVGRMPADARDEDRRELFEALAATERPVPMYLLRHALSLA